MSSLSFHPPASELDAQMERAWKVDLNLDLDTDRFFSDPLEPEFESAFDPKFDLEARALMPPSSLLQTWLHTQALNVGRHVSALVPFKPREFGTSIASPSRAHVQSVNALIRSLHTNLDTISDQISAHASAAIRHPETAQLHRLLRHKDQGSRWVKQIEKVWDFYFEIFTQRQSRFGPWLLGSDRIALDAYQVIYTHLGAPRSIPTPGPFSYMETGFSPATFRRGIPLSKLGKQINPFPLIQLPYHRLVNPWTLGAILHEVSHDLQTDLAMRQVVPLAIARRLRQAGMSKPVIKTWACWHSETWADLCGLLLGGPVMVESLMDIAARSPKGTFGFIAGKPHPTPYLRIFLNTELLCRMGFARHAKGYNAMWRRLYPNPRAGNIPTEILQTFDRAKALVVDTLCFQPYKELGDRTLAQVTGEFAPKHQAMIAEAAQRMAHGNDPGIIPERFLIGASRYAVNRRLATPSNITRHFYRSLARR